MGLDTNFLNYLGRQFTPPDNQELQQQASQNALLRNAVQQAPMRNQALQLQNEQEGLHNQALRGQLANQGRTLAAQYYSAIARSDDPLAAAKMAMSDPDFASSSQAAGVPLHKDGITPTDTPESIRQQATSAARMLGVDPFAKDLTVVPAGAVVWEKGKTQPVFTNPKEPTQETLHAVIDPKTGKPVMLPSSQAKGMQPAPSSAFSSYAPLIPGTDPQVDSYRQQILAGNATLANVPMNFRGSVAKALSETPKEQYSPTASSRMTLAASRITQPFTNMSAYKLTADGKPYLERIDAALKNPGSVSDQDLLDSLTKLNTGGNAVTEAQVRLITQGKSLSDLAASASNTFKNGGVLSPNQRQQIHDIAYQIYENYKKGYQPIYEQAAKQLTQAGIPQQFWTIPDLNSLNSGPVSSGAPQPQSGAGSAPPEAVAYLKQHPELAPQFKAKYGYMPQ